MDLDMPLYFFRISQGRYSGASDEPYEFENREAAWAEMTAVCGNLLGGISRNLKENAEWRMELFGRSEAACISHPPGRGIAGLERDPEKWAPVLPRDKRGTYLRGDHAQRKKLERDEDSKKSHRAPACLRGGLQTFLRNSTAPQI